MVSEGLYDLFTGVRTSGLSRVCCVGLTYIYACGTDVRLDRPGLDGG